MRRRGNRKKKEERRWEGTEKMGEEGKGREGENVCTFKYF